MKQYDKCGPEVQSSSDNEWTEIDRKLMRRAIELARNARVTQETPVGAVLARGETVLGEGWNRPISSADPTSHAEMEALRQSAARIHNYRLPGTTLYVTLEPCVMCAGAIVIARIARLVFATRDIRFGAVRSKFQLADSELLNHRVIVEEGLFAAEAAQILSDFFKERR